MTKMPMKNEFAEARKCTNTNEMRLERITIAVTIPIDKGAKKNRSSSRMEF